MADILIKRKHSQGRNEVLEGLKPYIEKTARQYGFRLQWSNHGCKFYGAAQGILKVQADSIIFAARLGLLARLNKDEITSEIVDVLNSVLQDIRQDDQGR